MQFSYAQKIRDKFPALETAKTTFDARRRTGAKTRPLTFISVRVTL